LRLLFSILLSTFTAACSADVIQILDSRTSQPVVETNSEEIITAIQYINYGESTHRAELRKYVGVDPVRTEWCAAFVNAVLEESGVEGSSSVSDVPLMARSFLEWGVPVDKKDIQSGDIVIFPRGNRGWQGHVGFFIKSETINNVEYWWILGGNQKNRVSIVPYPARKSLGVRRSQSV